MTLRLPWSSALALVVALAACEGEGKDGPGDMLVTETASAESDEDGLAAITVPVEAGDTQFLVTGVSDEYLSVENVIDPDGNVALTWEDWSGANSLTWAIYANNKDVVLNWPVRAADDELVAGDWTVNIATTDNDGFYTGGVGVDATIQRKADDDLSSGTVRVRVAYTEGVSGDDAVKAAMEEAMDVWTDLYASWGLTLEAEYTDTDLSDDLVSPGTGSGDEYFALSSEGTDSDISVLIGELIDGNAETLGMAGNIPNAIVPTPRASLVVSWLTSAGPDGEFSDEDIRILGETLAHEAGHYIGLFHPVESNYNAWDALSDTEECEGRNDCESVFAHNLMFPYSICDNTSCNPTDEMSDQQVGVTQRYTGTL
jgi:hypothetical protein